MSSQKKRRKRSPSSSASSYSSDQESVMHDKHSKKSSKSGHKSGEDGRNEVISLSKYTCEGKSLKDKEQDYLLAQKHKKKMGLENKYSTSKKPSTHTHLRRTRSRSRTSEDKAADGRHYLEKERKHDVIRDRSERRHNDGMEYKRYYHDYNSFERQGRNDTSRRHDEHFERFRGSTRQDKDEGSRISKKYDDSETRSIKYRSREDEGEIGSRYYQHLEEDKEISSVSGAKSRENDTLNDGKLKKEPPKKKFDPISSKTGGAYIPPAMLKLMQASITDKSSAEYQRISWEALKKSIHGLINKVNRSNIDKIIRQLLKENIVRGRGLLTRSIAQAQAMSVTFTCVYAALTALINSRFPNIGELLLKRLVIQFRRGFKRNDKASCIAAVSFIAHLVNQRVAHEILALEILTLLVETPTNDSIEVAIAFLKECGMKLTEVSKKGIDAIFEMLRNVLHEGKVDERVKHMIEVMFQVRKDKFKDNEAIPDGLDLVEEEDQFTHLITLEDATDGEDILNVFSFDPEYTEHEAKYKELSKEMVGDSDEESEGGDDGSDEEEDENDDEEQNEPEKQVIVDNTETNLIALRRTIYLAIYSSLDFEECAHKLMRMQLKPGQEAEVCSMILDCCCEMRTYERFYGLLAQRFCQVNRTYIPPFESLFKDTYSTVHRLKTNQCRNVAKLFAHLLFTDAISWDVLSCIQLNEEDTTSSGRIFIKILFHELSEYMGLVKLNERVKDPTLQSAFMGLFPRDNPRNTRFSINFFTSIGLGGLTDELREHLKVAIQTEAALLPVAALESSSSSSSSEDDDVALVSSDSSDDSDLLISSDSDSDASNNKKKSNLMKKAKKRKKSQTSDQGRRRRRR